MRHVREGVGEIRSLKKIRLLAEDEELDGGDVLPGFRIHLSEIFGPRG